MASCPHLASANESRVVANLNGSPANQRYAKGECVRTCVFPGFAQVRATTVECECKTEDFFI
jgi:hypothetical protein